MVAFVLVAYWQKLCPNLQNLQQHLMGRIFKQILISFVTFNQQRPRNNRNVQL